MVALNHVIVGAVLELSVNIVLTELRELFELFLQCFFEDAIVLFADFIESFFNSALNDLLHIFDRENSVSLVNGLVKVGVQGLAEWIWLGWFCGLDLWVQKVGLEGVVLSAILLLLLSLLQVILNVMQKLATAVGGQPFDPLFLVHICVTVK